MKFDLKKYVIGNFKVRGLFLLFQILLTIILPLTLTPEKFGVLSLVFTNANFAFLLTSFGIPSTLSFYASKKPTHRHQLINILFIASFFQLTLVITIEFIFRYFTHSFLIWPTHSIILGLAGIMWYWAIALNEKLNALYNGLLEVEKYLKINAFFIALQVLLLSGNHYFKWWDNGNTSIYIVISATFLQGLITCLWFYFSIAEKNTEPYDKSYFGYAFSAYLANLIQFLAVRSDIWIINYYQSSSAVGYYAFASKLGQFFLVIPVMLAAIVFPLLAAKKITISTLESMIRLMNGILLSIGAIAFLAAHILIPLVWQNKYNGSIITFMLLVPGFIAQAQVCIYAAYYASIAKIKVNILTSLVTFSSLVIVDLLLMPLYGIEGAAIGFTIANIGSAGLMIYLFNKRNELASIRIFPKITDWRNVLNI